MSKDVVKKIELKEYTNQEIRNMLGSDIHILFQTEPFLGALLQELSIYLTQSIPAIAGIKYNVKMNNFEIFLHSQYWTNLQPYERVAVLKHEIMHFTNKHIFRSPFFEEDAKNDGKVVSEWTFDDHKKRALLNIAQDMSINQYISNLPKTCVNVEQWKDEKGQPFPLYKTCEEYFKLININQQKQEQSGKSDKQQSGQGEKSKKDKSDTGNQKSKNGEGGDYNWNDPNQKLIDQYVGEPMDSHDWDNLSEEEKEEMLKAARDMVKRSLEKVSKSYSVVPKAFQDFLDTLEMEISKVNAKQILKNAIKKTISLIERQNTWNRPSKRYMQYSPGTTLGKMPNVKFYIDSSGSMSIKELNEGFRVTDEFLRAGQKKCKIALWHTDLYNEVKYKIGQELEKSSFQSGGTDITCVMEDIIKNKPDLAIIFTDGYYGDVTVSPKTEILFVITKDGTVDHPTKRFGKTIKLSDILE